MMCRLRLHHRPDDMSARARAVTVTFDSYDGDGASIHSLPISEAAKDAREAETKRGRAEMRKAIVALAVAAALLAAIRFERAATGRQAAPPQASPPQASPPKEAPLHRGGYLNSYIALLKSDLGARKTGFITEGLRLTDKEAAAFWPIYRSYEAERKRLDARRRLIQDYADNYGRMTDAKAGELIRRRFALEEQRLALQKAYLERLEKALPGKTVARFFQLEYRFGLMTDLKISAEVPLIE